MEDWGPEDVEKKRAKCPSVAEEQSAKQSQRAAKCNIRLATAAVCRRLLVNHCRTVQTAKEWVLTAAC